MDRDLEEMGELGSDDVMLVDRSKLSHIIGMEIPAIGLESKASFERLMRALDKRRGRQRRWRLLIACSLGAATVIIGLIMMIRFLSSPPSIAGRRSPSRDGLFATANRR
jgi:hypothetical protein